MYCFKKISSNITHPADQISVLELYLPPLISGLMYPSVPLFEVNVSVSFFLDMLKSANLITNSFVTKMLLKILSKNFLTMNVDAENSPKFKLHLNSITKLSQYRIDSYDAI